MSFANAIRNESNKTSTENGMKAFKSSKNANVDLFFAIAASRGKDITDKFAAALAEDQDLALRCMLWARDAREGAGERQTFRNLLKFIERTKPQLLDSVLPLVAEMGRWDDLLVFEDQEVKNKAMSLIGQALFEQNALCAKWMPRKGKTAVELRTFFGLTPKQYRKGLVALSDTVEQRMCAKAWDSIEFGKLPSQAASRYQKAFLRNAAVKYNEYKGKLVKGEAKVNAGVAYPYEVVRGLELGDEVVSTAQWNALPNYLSGDTKILPMVDVSGSMESVRVTPSVTAMDVAVSLGLYIADKQEGAFKGAYLTFAGNPKLTMLTPGHTIKQKLHSMKQADWDMSTNIEKAYNEILRVAVKNKVKQADMPAYLLIFSDMQFNQATGSYYTSGADKNAYKLAREAFKNAGYELPKIVFWNLADRGNNIPVKHDTDGTALVSGFSPSLVKSILSAKQFSPEGVMLETLMKDRYTPLA